MKKIIQKSLVIALVYYAVAIIGCVKCNCKNIESKEFKYKEIAVQNLRFSFVEAKNYIIYELNIDSVERNQYGLGALINYELALNKCTKKNNGFINAVYACDCVIGEPFSKDTFDKISIITLRNLDDSHLAGSDVTDYFKIVGVNSMGSLVYNNLDFYNIQRGSLFPIDWNGKAIRELYFTNPKNISDTVMFEIRIKHSNGTTISAQSKPVFLQ
jgi:hypothetical protein